jgi:hypothetical protein
MDAFAKKRGILGLALSFTILPTFCHMPMLEDEYKLEM